MSELRDIVQLAIKRERAPGVASGMLDAATTATDAIGVTSRRNRCGGASGPRHVQDSSQALLERSHDGLPARWLNPPVLAAQFPEARTFPSAVPSADGPRAFNRFELKYVVDPAGLAAFRESVVGRLDADTNGRGGLYPVWSRYYDTHDLRFYWEKVDGIKFRRKLRIRHYGTPGALAVDTRVWVEIKQRVNRVTQKRRLRLPYAEAIRLCQGAAPEGIRKRDMALASEIRGLVTGLRLHPSTAVGYVREAFLGRDEDYGLRVTFDSRLRGRDRDLDLGAPAENRFIIAPHLAVIEIKANDRVPYWLTEKVAALNMRLVRLSKYCQSVEAFDRAPRSVFHVDEDPKELRA